MQILSILLAFIPKKKQRKNDCFYQSKKKVAEINSADESVDE
jgi:hypothetical protein